MERLIKEGTAAGGYTFDWVVGGDAPRLEYIFDFTGQVFGQGSPEIVEMLEVRIEGAFRDTRRLDPTSTV